LKITRRYSRSSRATIGGKRVTLGVGEQVSYSSSKNRGDGATF